VLLLSRDEAYARRALVLVAPVTTRVRSHAAEVPLGPDDGLPQACVALLDSIFLAEKRALERPIAGLSREKMRLVDRAIHFALGLED
jgi:mRNA-degrading endonuclease toxin of MazEF toxin-antitoxin module